MCCLYGARRFITVFFVPLLYLLFHLTSFYNLRIHFLHLHFNIIFESKPQSPKCAEVFQHKNLCIRFILLDNVNLLYDAENANYEARHYVSRLTAADVIYIGLFLFQTTDQRVEFRFSGHILVSWSAVVISFCWFQLDKV
jgi:hypothetical protein